jgi:hypothetical protein
MINRASAKAQSTDDLSAVDVNILEDFYNAALKWDRGVANSPFAGSTDEWLAMHMVLNRHLGDRMQLALEQIHMLVPQIRVRATVMGLSEQELERLQGERKNERNSGLKSEDSATTFDPSVAEAPPTELGHFANINVSAQKNVARVLNAAQLDILDCLYLNLEGLVAISRPHLAKRLSLTPDQQTEVWKALRDNLDNISLAYHQALFTLNKDSKPETKEAIIKSLRESSARLDRRVGTVLTTQQQRDLVHILKECRQWDDSVVSPGALAQATLENIKQASQKTSSIK